MSSETLQRLKPKRDCVCLCVTFGPSHWPGFVESTEPQEISWDGETDLRPCEGFKWDPGKASKGQERQVKRSTMRQRAGEEKRGKIKEEWMDEIRQRLVFWYQWNATWRRLCSSPFTSTHIPTLSCTPCLLLSTFPCCSLAHTRTKAGAINLPKSAAGMETPKDRAYAVFGENADVPASSASSSVPFPTLLLLLLHFILLISLWSSLVSCSFMLLTPFNLNLSHISSTVASKPPFSLWSRSKVMLFHLGGTKRPSWVLCHCLKDSQNKRTDNTGKLKQMHDSHRQGCLVGGQW